METLRHNAKNNPCGTIVKGESPPVSCAFLRSFAFADGALVWQVTNVYGARVASTVMCAPVPPGAIITPLAYANSLEEACILGSEGREDPPL